MLQHLKEWAAPSSGLQRWFGGVTTIGKLWPTHHTLHCSLLEYTGKYKYKYKYISNTNNDDWKAMTYTPHTALQSFKIYWQIQIQKYRSNTNTNTLTYQIQITIGKLWPTHLTLHCSLFQLHWTQPHPRKHPILCQKLLTFSSKA